MFNFVSSGLKFGEFDLIIRAQAQGYIEVLAYQSWKVEKGYTSANAERVEVPKLPLAYYIIGKNVDLDEVTAVAYSNGFLGINLPVVKINQKPLYKIEI